MQKEYRETVEDLVLANDHLIYCLNNECCLNDYYFQVLKIEMFALAFTIFSDCLGDIRIDDELFDSFVKHEYYFENGNIMIKGKKISVEKLEIIFVNILNSYRSMRTAKVFNYADYSRVKIENNKSSNFGTNGCKIFGFKSYERTKPLGMDEIKIANAMNNHKLDKEGYTKEYFNSLRYPFKDLAYDTIVYYYNTIKGCEEVPLFQRSSNKLKTIKGFGYMLLNLYPLTFYAKGKDVIDYGALNICHVFADIANFRYDDEWVSFNEELKTIADNIEACKVFLRSRKVKKSVKWSVYQQMEKQEKNRKRLIDERCKKFMMCGDTIEFDLDNNCFYTGNTWNKHVLYNLELALKSGFVDVSEIEEKEGKIKLYGVVGDDIDFILEIDRYFMAEVFNIDNMLDSLKSSNDKGMVVSH